jgi:hypothetical protein
MKFSEEKTHFSEEKFLAFARASGLRIHLDELPMERSVVLFQRQELLVRTTLDDRTLIKNQDKIGISDRTQPVRHDKTRASAQQRHERFLQPRLGYRINRTSLLI